MKLLTAAAATSLATLLPAVTADFVLYAQNIGGNGIIDGAQGWQVYPDVADCDSVRDWIWRTSDDVSGGKYGVRCKGSCRYGNEAPDMEEIEMNFNNDDLHFTWYRERDWGLYDLSDKYVGNCTPITHPGREFDCGLTISQTVGRSKLYCKVDASAEQIYDSKPE